MKHITPIQIRFKDADAMGHINHANHVTYMELARVTFLDELFGKELDWKKQGIILASLKIDYIIPIHLRNEIFVETWCSKIGTKSFNLEHQIVKKKAAEEIVLAKASTVLVCYDYLANQSIPVPEKWKSNLTKYCL
jgi:acyl-CoA thioester hydrolase